MIIWTSDLVHYCIYASLIGHVKCQRGNGCPYQYAPSPAPFYNIVSLQMPVYSSSRAHFTDSISIKIQIPLKLHFAVIKIPLN